jgi:hypothetical protein
MAAPRQAIVTKPHPDNKDMVVVIQGLAQVQGARVIVQQPDGSWHNYSKKECVIIWDPEQQTKRRAY